MQRKAGHPCLGYGSENRHEIWFSPYFLSVCYVEYDAQSDEPKAKGGIDLPFITWQRDGRKITKTSKRTGKVTIWMLTDEYDCQGHRLGIWPD